MTRQEAELLMIEDDINSLKASIKRETEWLMRQATEMKQGAEHGYDLTCHASNVTSAAIELATISARLDSLNRARKALLACGEKTFS